MTSPLCSYQHTHAGEFEGGAAVGAHTHGQKHTVKHKPLTKDNNSACECPLKDMISVLQLTKTLSNDCSQKSAAFLFDMLLALC